jgi:hypothetical protein
MAMRPVATNEPKSSRDGGREGRSARRSSEWRRLWNGEAGQQFAQAPLAWLIGIRGTSPLSLLQARASGNSKSTD